MTIPNQNKNLVCPREEIGLYLDGELDAQEEILLEDHLSICGICKEELNLQKQMLSALSLAFEEKNEIEIPKNFTKIVVTKAESGVNGLRCKDERNKALFLSLILLLLITVGLSGENEKVFSILRDFSNQIITVGSFILHFTFDISFGISVILRNLCQKIVISPSFVLLTVSFLSFLTIILIARVFQKLVKEKISS